ncbi:MAG: DUF3127 domain-containing protein [Lentimicrobiaceae bacterium]|nr:DUF3127 domain-containing protein [Lentimicrobiaceae bacterium]
MEITGRIVKILPLLTGEGKNGPWKKQEFVVETNLESQYPKKICFSMWGDRIDQSPLNENENVKVFFDIESREYNERWYTDCRAWRVDKVQNTPTASEMQSQIPTDPASQPTSIEPEQEFIEEDDLPF